MFTSSRKSTRLVLRMVLGFIISFGVILPLFLWNRPFSIYYRLDKTRALEKIEQRNLGRIIDAEKHFDIYKEHSYHFNYRRLQSENLYMLITIVTTVRTATNERLEYLLQSVISVHRELVENKYIHAALMICNVDGSPTSHKEAVSLSQYFPTVIKDKTGMVKDIYEKEKDDYIYCLEQSRLFNPQFVLMVEDDAVPYRGMLSYLHYILDTKVSTLIQRGECVNRTEPWLAVKLYYPQMWMGFSYETLPLLQLTGICCVFASLFGLFVWAISIVFRQHFNLIVIYLIMAMGVVYGIFIAYGVGRQNLFELCRIHPMFFHIYRAPGCCTQAMLFPVNRIPYLVNYLNHIQCKSKFGIDLAIDAYAEQAQMPIYQVVPNLFHHIGVHSTLTSNKNRYEEFLI